MLVNLPSPGDRKIERVNPSSISRSLDSSLAHLPSERHGVTIGTKKLGGSGTLGIAGTYPSRHAGYKEIQQLAERFSQ
jgi:hypothetical protein